MKKRVIVFSALCAQGVVFAQESGVAFEKKGERRQELGASKLAQQKGTGAFAQKATSSALSSAGKISDPVGKSASALDTYSASLAKSMTRESLVSGLLSVAGGGASAAVSEKFATLRVSAKELFGHKSEVEKLIRGRPDIAKNLERPLVERVFPKKVVALSYSREMIDPHHEVRRDRARVIAQAQKARKAQESTKMPTEARPVKR